jgi:hypothetical protein
VVSSVVLDGRLVMTVAPAKLSLGAGAAWAVAGSATAAKENPSAMVISNRLN